MSVAAGSESPQFLVHRDRDHVGVPAADLEPRTVHGVVPSSNANVTASLREPVPLGQELMKITDRTINGRLTHAESLGHREFVLTKLYPCA